MPSSNAQASFEALKREILELGFVRPGSLVRRFMPCGNPACRCMGKPPQLHGPYSQWSYKIAGRTRTMRLSEQQARLCKQWVRNHKRLKRLVRRMVQLSLNETDRTLGAISRP
jgi:hypothetical protein